MMSQLSIFVLFVGLAVQATTIQSISLGNVIDNYLSDKDSCTALRTVSDGYPRAENFYGQFPAYGIKSNLDSFKYIELPIAFEIENGCRSVSWPDTFYMNVTMGTSTCNFYDGVSTVQEVSDKPHCQIDHSKRIQKLALKAKDRTYDANDWSDENQWRDEWDVNVDDYDYTFQLL